MSELEEAMLSRLHDFGGESSAYLMTNPEGPWGELGDMDTLMGAIKSLHDQGAVVYDVGSDVVAVA